MPATLIDDVRVSKNASRNIRKTVLSNGLLVLTESMPHVRSVSMGAWIGSGSRDEAAEVNGISHFVEHMVFKGTTTRSAQQIAREVDTIGGNLDAFTIANRWYPFMFSRAGLALQQEYSWVRSNGVTKQGGAYGNTCLTVPTCNISSSSVFIGVDFDF